MKSSIREVLQFFGFLTLTLILVLAGHLAVLYFKSFPLLENKIILAYSVNYFFALLAFIFLYYLKEKVPSHLGFIFMGSSLLKFILFLVLINPSYKMDGVTTKLEFMAFFIPYAFSLTIEVFFLVKVLSK